MKEDVFIAKVMEEWNYATEHDFKDIEVEITTKINCYEIYESDDGYICDPLDGIYSSLESIAEDLYSRVYREKIISVELI